MKTESTAAEYAPPSIASRVLRGLASGAFSLAARVFLQLVQVPLLLSLWGVERYGEWLILSTLPTYLSLSGGGVYTVAGNAASAAIAAGDLPRARSIFRAAWVLTSISNAVLLMLAGLAVMALAAVPLVSFRTIGLNEALATIFLFVVHMVLRLQGTLLSEAPLRMRGRYAEAQAIETTAQLAELAAMASCIWLFHGMAWAVLGLVAVRAVVLAGLVLRLLVHDRRLLGRGSIATVTAMRELIAPSLSLLLFPLAQSLQFEGITLAIGYWLGPAAVALYATMRTLARSADLALFTGYNILMAEASYLVGSNGARRQRTALGLGTLASVFAAFAIAGAIGVVAPTVFPLWTAGKLPFDGLMFASVIGVALLKGAYLPSLAMVVASNRHSTLAAIFVAGASVTLAVACAFGALGGNVYALAACALIGETIFAIATVRSATSKLQCSLAECLALAWRRIAGLSGRPA